VTDSFQRSDIHLCNKEEKTMNGQADVQAAPDTTMAEIEPVKLQRLHQEIRDNQNLVFGIIGGAVAAAVGAGIWAAVTVLTNYQIGWMAIGVGVLVGMAVRLAGKGIDMSFGIVGAGLSLLGCLAGNLLSMCIVVSRQEAIGILDVVSQLNTAVVVELMQLTFSPIDLLFYGLAIYEGYRIAFRPISGEEYAKLVK
jgi:hypothetical protein